MSLLAQITQCKRHLKLRNQQTIIDVNPLAYILITCIPLALGPHRIRTKKAITS